MIVDTDKTLVGEQQEELKPTSDADAEADTDQQNSSPSDRLILKAPPCATVLASAIHLLHITLLSSAMPLL